MRLVLSIVVIALLLVSGTTVSAATLLGSLIGDGRVHGAQDTSADVGIRLGITGDYEIVTGALVEGDFLVAGIGFDTLERVGTSSVPLTGVNGFGILRIDTIASLPANPQGIPFSTLSFEAPTVAEWNAIVDDVFGGNTALYKTTAGGLVNIYDGVPTDFNRIAPPATLAGSGSTIGTLVAQRIGELGFTGAVVDGRVQDNGIGEDWIAVGPTAPGGGSLAVLNTDIIGSSIALSINRLTGFDGITFLPLASIFDGGLLAGATAEFVGSGDLSGYGDGLGAPVGPWQIGDDIDVSFRPFFIPEPGSMLIWAGMGLAGVVGAYRRRHQKLAA